MDFPDFPDDSQDLNGEEYLGRFDLDNEGEFSVDIWQNTEIDPELDFHWDFNALFAEVGFDRNDPANLIDVLTIPLYDGSGEARIDIGGEDVRGGYDFDELQSFLNHTGFWGLASVYFDNELDEYFVDLEDVSG